LSPQTSLLDWLGFCRWLSSTRRSSYTIAWRLTLDLVDDRPGETVSDDSALVGPNGHCAEHPGLCAESKLRDTDQVPSRSAYRS
jgi:hypothetical protein